MCEKDLRRSKLSEPSIKYRRKKATKCSQTMNFESMKNDSKRNKASDFFFQMMMYIFFQNVRRM